MLTEDELRVKVSELVAYARDHISMNAENRIYVTNILLDFFNLTYPAPVPEKYGDFQTEIIDPIVQHAVDTGRIKPEEALLFETKVLGIVTPTPAEIISEFDSIAGNKGVQDATTWLFELSKANNYIRMPDIRKNIKWSHEGSIGNIDITINLSKPEKDPKAIAAAKLLPKTGYPACMLCPENVGFAGNLNHPARQTLRTIPIELDGEPWELQYSPYQYYTEHVIAFSSEHRPMAVTDAAFRRLLDFVDLFPHYFIGSNAALPIVGGSILTHDHYQGGAKVLPMMTRDYRRTYKCVQYPDVEIGILDWYNSVVRVKGRDREGVYNMAKRVLDTWFNWTDEDSDVICRTDEQHNAITPICRNNDGEYVFDLILRNNRTDEKHPYGIFHPEESMHNIKKEGIGIIEVMGLFILPGRLKKELAEVEKYLTGENVLDLKALSDPENPMCKHAQMILQLVNDNGNANSAARAQKIVTDYVNVTCEKILECTGVFKNTELGQKCFDKFMTKGLNLLPAEE